MNIKRYAVLGLTLMSGLGATAHAETTAADDQVAASFERLLTHSPAGIAVAANASRSAEVDPLQKAISAVLWAQPSYHLTAQNELALAERKRSM